MKFSFITFKVSKFVCENELISMHTIRILSNQLLTREPTESTFLISLKKLPHSVPKGKGKFFPAPKLGLVTSAQRVPAQTKKEKLGQFSGSKPSGLSPQRALLNLGRPWTSPKGPFGTECGSQLS
jgi:hypothetical protein